MSPHETLFLESTNKIVKSGDCPTKAQGCNATSVPTRLTTSDLLLAEPTVRLERFADISNSAFVQFQIWDFPGHMDVNDPGFEAESVFKQCGALVFVIDAQARPIVPLR